MNAKRGHLCAPEIVEPFMFAQQPCEYRVTALRECPTPDEMMKCHTPSKVAAYWKRHIASHPYFDPDRECLAVFFLNTRRLVKGHQLVSIGTMDTILLSTSAVFRLAIMVSAAAIVIAHNHPSGDASPSDADIKATRELLFAGKLLKLELVDHVIIGRPNHFSLLAHGLFNN